MFEDLEGRALLASITATASIRELNPPPGGPSGPSSSYHIYGVELNNSSSSSSGIGTFWFAWVPGKNLLATQPYSEVPDQPGWSTMVTHTGAGDGYGIEFTVEGPTYDVPPGGNAVFLLETTDTLPELLGDSVFYPSTPVLSCVVYPQGPGSDAGHPLVVTAGTSGGNTNPPPGSALVSVTSVTLGTPDTGNPHVQEQTIVIHFSGALDAAEADNVGTYRLVTAGKRGSFTARNSRSIALRSAAYDPATTTVILTARKHFPLTKPIQLTVHGTGLAGLQDAEGRLIDGNDDGQPGGDAVFVITRQGIQ
jgi:hypothetical protein